MTLPELLEQSEWLRRLARALTNEHDAEDVVQETWLNVLHRRPATVRDLRAWLATVARHVSRSAGRASRARRRREQLIDPGAQQPADPAEVADRVSLERRVSGIVLGLDPIYRDPILLRFWEDLGPGAIGERLNIPLDTVRTRLRRGLARVRDALDRGGGGRDGWYAALAGWAASRTAAVPAGLLGGTLVVTATTKLTVTLLIAGGLLVAIFALVPAGRSTVDGSSADSAPRDVVPSEPASVEDGGRVERTPVASLAPPVTPSAAAPESPPSRPPSSMRLRVVDADTLLELPSVTLFVHEGFPSDALVRPARDRSQLHAEVSDAASPIALEWSFTIAHYWVHADGHAWGRVSLDCSAHGDRVLRLPRAATLRVRLSAPVRQPGLFLRLRNPGNDVQVLHEQPLPPDDATAEVLELPPGPIVVSCEGGDAGAPIVLGRTTVELRGGESATAVIAIAPIARETAVPVAGRLVVPPEWGSDLGTLELERDDAPTLVRPASFSQSVSDMRGSEGDSELHFFDAGRLAPGHYALRVTGIDFHGGLEVGAQGDTEVEIAVPAPADLMVRLRDASTDELLAGEQLLCLVGGSRSRAFFKVAREERDEIGPIYRARIAAGARVELRLTGTSTLASEQCSLETKPGPNELTVRVNRASRCELRISLRDGEAVLPFNHTLSISVEQVDGDGHSESGAFDGRGATLVLTRPGRYRVRLGPVPGYAPIAEQLIDVDNEKRAELVIALSRP